MYNDKTMFGEKWQVSMVTHVYNPSTREADIRDHEFKVSLGYLVSSRLPWATLSQTKVKIKREEKGRRNDYFILGGHGRPL
jgi:hypothetical protein